MSVLIEDLGAVRVVRLDWPESRNALGVEEGGLLTEALIAAGADENVHAILLAANGKAFCAGGHLRAIADFGREGADVVREVVYTVFQGLFRAIEDMPIPIVAAVDGPAIGVGADLALAADATFIGEKGKLVQGWMKLGLVPATGGTEYVRRRGGRSAVWQFLVSEGIDAAAAEKLGLGIAATSAYVDALALARTLATMPREQLGAVRKLSRISAIDAHWAAALDYQADFLSRQSFLDKADEILSMTQSKREAE